MRQFFTCETPKMKRKTFIKRLHDEHAYEWRDNEFLKNIPTEFIDVK